MNNAFLEIGCEHLPSRFVKPALSQMENLAKTLLDEKRIAYQNVSAFGTYRRLCVIIEGIADKSADIQKEVKGPPAKLLKDANGAFTPQSAGFAQRNGIKPEDLIIKETEKGPFIYADLHIKGEKTAHLLPEIFVGIITGMEFAKNMVWEESGLKWGRPIRSLIGLYGSKVVPFEVAGVKSNRYTYPITSFGRKPIRVEKADKEAYVQLLKSQPQPILVLPQDRREALIRSVMSEAKARGYHADLDQDLIEETIYFTEHPVAVCGDFDLKFLTLPKAFIGTIFKTQLKMFPVVNESSEIQPYFIAVRDGVSNNQDEVRNGFKKVMSARMSDAVFFYENDKKEGLDHFKNKLAERTFLEGLGNLLEKSDRTRELAMWMCDRLNENAIKDSVTYAAGYAYADLASSVVYEFPELQGYMGGRYAELEGHKEEARAIEQVYFPLSSNSDLPDTLTGALVSLAGKLDTLAGNFIIGQIPTGSEDPFALRRQAFGAVRILLESGINLSLQELIEKALSLYSGKETAEAEKALKDFFYQRLALLMQQRGHQPTSLNAVNHWYSMPLENVETLIQVLETNRQGESFAAAAEAAKRVCNILKKADITTDKVDASLFQLPAEKELFDAVEKAESIVALFSAGCQSKTECEKTLSVCATFAQPLAKFFADVMVNAEDVSIRQNRLALLARVRKILTQGMADITKL
ncbi:MAG: glycine--tRNA ligase subunit beta [Elusimicrobiaceae bacterium]|nr:glycine--tRNA ligase subunit beta [Elusimicrobiaceae bacterium]